MRFLPHRLRAIFAATLLATVAFSAAASAGCGSCCCGRSAVYAPAVQIYEPHVTPSYLVNQGPVYSGPAINVPFLTYSESLSAHGYPYVRSWRGHYVRGYSDVFDGGGYARPTSYRRPYYHHRYRHHSRAHGADGRALDVRTGSGVSVIRARANVRYVNPERMDIQLYRDQKPRKKHRED